MLKNYVPSHVEEVVSWQLNFLADRNWGFSFGCDSFGRVDMEKLSPEARENYVLAMTHPERFPYAWNEVEKIVQHDRIPARGTCVCGKRIDLVNQYMGACECSGCGRWYNLFGQRLKHPRYWEDNY